MSWLRSMFVLGVSLAVWAPTAAGADANASWPQWRGPKRNGTSTETGLLREWRRVKPKVLWRANVGIGFSSFAVSNGLVYTLGNRSNTDTVYALSAKTGKPVWKYSYPCPIGAVRHEGGPYATPTVDGDKVYTFSKQGKLICFTAATGKIAWQADVAKLSGAKPPNYGFSSSPLMVGGLLIVNAGSNGLALHKGSGRLAWKSTGTGRAGHASPVLFRGGGQRCVVILAEGQLSGVSPVDGRVFWMTALPKGTLSYKICDPVPLGGKLFISSSYKSVCSMYQVTYDSIRELWKSRNLLTKMLNPVVSSGYIYSSHRESMFRCIDPANGHIKWEKELAGNPILVDDKCVILTVGGELILAKLSPSAFTEFGRFPVLDGKCWTPPALAGGKLYCRNAMGSVACVDIARR